jgi:hypothetical protein
MSTGFDMPAAGTSPQGKAYGDPISGGLNAGAIVQGVKMVMGGAGDFALVTPDAPFAVRLFDNKPAGALITTQDDGPAGFETSLGLPITGAPTPGSAATFLLNGGEGTIRFSLGGSAVGGNYVMESSPDTVDGDDGTWTLAFGRQVGTSSDISAWVSQANAKGHFVVPVGGMAGFRVRNLFGGTSLSTEIVARLSAAPFVAYTRIIGGAVGIDPNGNIIDFALPESTHRVFSTASTNATLVKGGYTVVHAIQITNDTLAKVYLKLYAKVTTPTASDTPVVTIPIAIGAIYNFNLTRSRTFAPGMAYRIVAGLDDTNDDPVGVGVTGEILYT